ncbi:nuclear transport factor 2 family protein [Sungkyunkwania multivorans]|uniref:Nuclear transport factor 2 family protein n=1 Tax=Sungkyunkwania multivorans TaxID=1173618 RepID=A0ABW3CX91_9FLAO
MKEILFLIILWLVSLLSHAQVSDEKAIEQAAIDYMESYYESNTSQMERAVHEEVAKRHVVEREGFQLIKNMGYTELVSLTKLDGKKWSKEKDQPLRVAVKILDIDGNIASIKALTNQYNFYDYMHLAKIDGQWKIINVLWDSRKENKN